MDDRIAMDDGQEDVVYMKKEDESNLLPAQLLVPNILGDTYIVSDKEGRIMDALKLVQCKS
jgi:hypothetical protein